MGEAEVGAHGVLMIVAFLIVAQLAETIAVYASNKTNLRQNYFKAIEHGTKLFNAHRLLNALAFILGLVGMIVILGTEEFSEGLSSKERHIAYGIAMIIAVFLQILFRVAYPQDSTKWIHRWMGRAINLWAFFVAFTGYELANFGTNEGTDAGGEDFNGVIIIFVVWYGLKLGLWAYYFAMRRMGKAKEYKVPDDVGHVQLSDKGPVAQTPSS